MPISTSNFDQAFRLLRLDLRTSRCCSWENYREYNVALMDIRQMLQDQARIPDARLVDAHSFCWMLARLSIPERPTVAPTPIAEPLGNIASVRNINRAGADDNRRSIVVDFEKLGEARAELGGIAEEIVLEAERARLKQAGRSDLATLVKSVSEQYELGYDIESFESDGTSKQIEVKAARRDSGKVSFFLSENERLVSRRLPNYYFYLVFNARSSARMIRSISGRELLQRFLTPVSHFVQFAARMS